MGVIRQTEEKDELPALWRNVCMRERRHQSATSVNYVVCLCNILKVVTSMCTLSHLLLNRTHMLLSGSIHLYFHRKQQPHVICCLYLNFTVLIFANGS